MRLETMIIGGVDNHVLLARLLLELRQGRIVFGHQRLLDKRVLAVLDEIIEQFDLGRVGNAKQRGIVFVERNIAQIAKVRLRVAHVHGADEIRAGKAPPLVALDAKSDDDDPHELR